ncbi:ATPase WRNIP1 isoform X1 [Arapaima gigas]
MALEPGGASGSSAVQCPVCASDFGVLDINAHLDVCLLSGGQTGQSSAQDDTRTESEPPCKKVRVSVESGRAETKASPAPAFSMFHRTKHVPPSSSPQQPHPAVTRAADPGSATTETPAPSTPFLSIRSLLASGKPLAEALRPRSLDEYFGQSRVLGEKSPLRSLLQTHDVPSLILWGPPGCGKTTLAHIIANNSKKKLTARFVTLSATSTSTNEVREVIKQAQNELRLCKRKTILFIDEIHRFNKLQQDTFLPHVECGTITLIGATTENPSFQVNAALLSRCTVLVLERLSVESMGAVLRRAVSALGLSVLREQETDKQNGNMGSAAQHAESEPKVYIEQKALDTIAHLCDGDARAALNGLQMTIQAQISAANLVRSGEDGKTKNILVQEEHVKEGLQRSHILYDKAGEEHYNCISALHKSMRGSHENAALYWLGRMLEGGEDPLYVARRLVRFASEDVGLADPSALSQAVSAFQACHFIGMPECEVILAQCVVYLARAPKSVEVYKAYDNVKICLRSHKGPLPPVPLHLRNAPTRLMKELGYAKGYKYNPAFRDPVEQDYLPEELKGVDFFTWKPSSP